MGLAGGLPFITHIVCPSQTPSAALVPSATSSTTLLKAHFNSDTFAGLSPPGLHYLRRREHSSPVEVYGSAEMMLYTVSAPRSRTNMALEI
jgi:hypothetical protein